MRPLDFRLDEGVKNQYRVVAYSGLDEIPCTDWHANALGALMAFGNAINRLTTDQIEERISTLERDITAERTAGKKAKP